MKGERLAPRKTARASVGKGRRQGLLSRPLAVRLSDLAFQTPEWVWRSMIRSYLLFCWFGLLEARVLFGWGTGQIKSETYQWDFSPSTVAVSHFLGKVHFLKSLKIFSLWKMAPKIKPSDSAKDGHEENVAFLRQEIDDLRKISEFRYSWRSLKICPVNVIGLLSPHSPKDSIKFPKEIRDSWSPPRPTPLPLQCIIPQYPFPKSKR